MGINEWRLRHGRALWRRHPGVRAETDLTRGERASMIYSISDPQVVELLAVAKQILTTSLKEATDLLADLDAMSY